MIEELTDRFPVGYYRLHPDTGLNFQLNRFYNWVGEPAMLEDLRAIAPRIADYGDWVRELVALAEDTLDQGRTAAGAYELRMAEFFMPLDDPRRHAARQRFVSLVRELHGLTADDVHQVPYGPDGHHTLPAYRLTSPHSRDTVVIFGGFDSYIEEWLPMLEALRDSGLDVIAFDGPGQGGALEEGGLPFTPEWQRPVAAVLDHFAVDDVTLIGCSLGGALVVRAAAGERRVRRVVAFDAMTDFLACMARQRGGLTGRLLRHAHHVPAAAIDAAASRAASRDLMADWGFRQAMHTLGAATPAAALAAAHRYRTDDASDAVDQDVLLLAGAEDHYVPLRQVHDQAAMLHGARSITMRIFGPAEHAQNHCQVGNLGLALRTILDWHTAVTSSREERPARQAAASLTKSLSKIAACGGSTREVPSPTARDDSRGPNTVQVPHPEAS